MKRYICKYLLYGFVLISASCTDFLDVAPESSLTEEDVFTQIANVNSYFAPVYSKVRNGNPLYMKLWDNRYNLEECTEAADCGRAMLSLTIRNGKMENNAVNPYINGDATKLRPILYENFRAIRICNNVIANAHQIENAISEEDVYDIVGQAYFMRGYAYLQVCNLWGGMPYIYEVMTSDDDWDRPRLSSMDTYKAVAADMDLAYENFVKAKKVRRDPKPGESGHLGASYNLELPNGCAALALKSRALLYAASPLHNKNNDEQLWRDAAAASWEAIKVAKENGYDLLPIDKWLNNTWNMKYTNEQIWADALGKKGAGQAVLCALLTGAMNNKPQAGAGMNPTQNFVDRYETAPLNNRLGFPMNTEEQRNAAIAAGAFNPQEPYKNLDKRFYHSIFYNMAPIVYNRTLVPQSVKNRINVWYQKTSTGGRIESDHVKQEGFVGYCTTGYMQKRLTGDMNWTNGASKEMTDPLFLLSELYLNYAEAANEIGGPGGSVDGGMTAYEALMVIRNRAEQGDVCPEFLTGKDVFRERIKNERCVELAFLGHYYFDSYRWTDAPKYRTRPLYGMDVEKLTNNYDKNKYPEGFRYTRMLLPEKRQTLVWRDEMYFFPFSLNIYYQFKTFDTSLNPYW